MIYSSIETRNGIPYLTVNGNEISSNAYITYFTEKARYDQFADAGYKLYSVPLFFASQTINESSDVPPLGVGIFEKKGNPDFAIVDRKIKEILDVCPDAYIFPRVNMTLPRWWELENPDELNDVGMHDVNKRRICFSSDKWAKATEDFLGQFLDYMENSPYRDRICGYQLAGGNTEEWFSFDFLGSIGLRSREKFAEYIKETGCEDNEVNYYKFLSYIVAKRICDFCAFAKKKLDRRLVIGVFYGYNLERPDRESCHNATEMVLNCDDVDFICSPVSYTFSRRGGIDHPCMLAVDSLKLHGKLYFAENDTRTHLTKPLLEHPHFYRPVFMARDKNLSIENIKLHYARALTHAHALWWFDMGGGWYDDSYYMEMLCEFLSITNQSKSKDMTSISQVAVIVDSEMMNSIPSGSEEFLTVYHIRRQLGLMGTPYDCYLASDFEKIRDKYKAFILLCPVMTKANKKILEENNNVFAVNVENKDLEPETLRSFCKEKGVHIYCDKDCVIFANNSYLFLHTASKDIHKINLPEGKKLKQIFGERVNPDVDILPENTGFLFEII